MIAFECKTTLNLVEKPSAREQLKRGKSLFELFERLENNLSNFLGFLTNSKLTN